VIGFSNHEERLQKYSQAVPAADIKSINAEAKNPNVLFQRVFTKEPLPVTGDTSVGCEEMIYYKGYWISPHGSFGKDYVDSITSVPK
jgi:hypothetical protein